MASPSVFKYNYAFLYQSMAVYATTLALYLIVRASSGEEFAQVFRDPVVYLLCVIIIVSALAVLYNIVMRRRITIEGSKLVLESARGTLSIDTGKVKAVRIRVEQGPGLISRVRVVTIVTSARKRPIRIRPYNFEQGDALLSAIKSWAGPLVQSRPRRRKAKPQ